MQLPTCQGRIVSLWVQAIKSKGGERESASIQYANHREEEPRCAAAEGTCCIYSPLILHWPPHTVGWAPAITTSIRNHPVRDDLEWNHCISGSPAVSLHLVISTLNKKRGQQDPGNVLLNIGCISAARKVWGFFPLNADVTHRCLLIHLSWFILSCFSLPGNSIMEQSWRDKETKTSRSPSTFKFYIFSYIFFLALV